MQRTENMHVVVGVMASTQLDEGWACVFFWPFFWNLDELPSRWVSDCQR
jgi:hypothetical protein